MSRVEPIAEFSHDHVTVMEPREGWLLLDVRELWAYRELFWVLTRRDLKVRYRQAVLGVAWAVLRPALTMLIFTVVFGQLVGVPSEGYPYAVFVFAGLLPWTFFAGSVMSGGTSLVASSNLVSKVYFPRLLIPLAAVGVGLADLLISTVLLLGLMVAYGVPWTAHLFAAPFVIMALVFTAVAVGTLLSALTVAYRDFSLLTPFLLQVWMYVTPVIYPASLVPEKWRWLVHLNPMSGMVEAMRATFLGKPFDLGALAISLGASFAVFVVAVAYFARVERRFADII